MLRSADFPLPALEGRVAQVSLAGSDFFRESSRGSSRRPKATAPLCTRRRAGEPERRAAVLGITGTGGAGKSSLTDELVRRFADRCARSSHRHPFRRSHQAQDGRSASRRPHPHERHRARERLHEEPRHPGLGLRASEGDRDRHRDSRRRRLPPGDGGDERHRPGLVGDRGRRRPEPLRDDARSTGRPRSSRRSTCSTSPTWWPSTSSTAEAARTRSGTCGNSSGAESRSATTFLMPSFPSSAPSRASSAIEGSPRSTSTFSIVCGSSIQRLPHSGRPGTEGEKVRPAKGDTPRESRALPRGNHRALAEGARADRRARSLSRESSTSSKARRREVEDEAIQGEAPRAGARASQGNPRREPRASRRVARDTRALRRLRGEVRSAGAGDRGREHDHVPERLPGAESRGPAIRGLGRDPPLPAPGEPSRLLSLHRGRFSLQERRGVAPAPVRRRRRAEPHQPALSLPLTERFGEEALDRFRQRDPLRRGPGRAARHLRKNRRGRSLRSRLSTT